MKNKKKNINKNKNLFHQWQFWVAMFFILSVIFLIEINLNETEFKFNITKEECKNETTLDSLSKAGCIINSSWDNDQFNITIVCPQCYDENCNLNFEEKVCELIEVEKIPMNCNPKDFNQKDYPKECLDYRSCLNNCIRWGSIYFPIYKDDPEKYECDCKFPTISKQDLTIEWLDKNCECVECGLKCKEYIYQKEEHEYDCGFDEEKGWCKGCKKYKCGDSYYVKIE